MSQVELPAISDYELIRLIGRGSYGDVWIARSVTGIFRAIKIVWRARFADAQPYEREFKGLKEFAAISLLESRQLALLHVGRNEAAGCFYYVMELADDAVTGREIDPASYVPHTLRELRTRRGRLPATEVIALGADLARALAGLHSRSLVHRDIKPSNIILVGGAPKLADIGLVAATSAAHTFVGTEGFVPPEGPGAPSADVFSLGKLLYELATGLDRHDYPRLPPDLHALPDRKELLELNEVLLRACESDATKRHRDATVLLDDLLLLQAGRSVRRLRATERSLNRIVRVAAALLLIAALASAGAWIERRRANNEQEQRQKAEAQRDDLARRAVYAATLAQAQRALEQDDYGRARTLLGQLSPGLGQPDLRGLEWRVLNLRAQGDPCQIVRAEGAPIDKLALSFDGEILAVHDTRAVLTLYGTKDVRPTRKIEGVKLFGGFSTDGRWLLGTDDQGALQRWRPTDGTLAGEPLGKPSTTYQIIGAQGTNRVVAWAEARPPALVVWDYVQRLEIVSLPIGEETGRPPWRLYRGAVVDPTGLEAVMGLMSGRSNNLVLHLAFARLGENPNLTHEAAPVRPAVLGRLAAEDGRPNWWAADDSTGRQTLFNRTDRRWELSPSPLPRGIVAQLVVQRGREEVTLLAHGAKITLNEGGRIKVFHGHAALLSGIAALPDGEHFFTASQGGELRHWDTRFDPKARNERQCWDSRTTANRVFFSPNSDRLYVPEDGKSVAVLDARTLERETIIPNMLRPFAVATDAVWGLSADGSALTKWVPSIRSTPDEFARNPSPVIMVALSADGGRICLTRLNGEMWIFNTAGQEERVILGGHHENLSSLELDSTGTTLWCASSDRQLSCRRLPEGRTIWSVPVATRMTAVRWLRQTNQIAVALENGDLQFYDAATGTLLDTKPSGSSACQSIATTKDGSRLAVAGIEGDVHVLDAGSGRYLTRLNTGAVDTLHYLNIAPDASALAILTNSGQLHMIRTR